MQSAVYTKFPSKVIFLSLKSCKQKNVEHPAEKTTLVKFRT